MLVGDCFTHLGAVCKEQFHNVHCYSIVPNAAFKKVLHPHSSYIIVDTHKKQAADIIRYIQAYFLREIDESKIDSIKVLEWLPSKRLFGEAHTAILEGLTRFIQQLKANLATTVYFGRTWIRNTIRNILANPKQYTFTTKLPCIGICAPGPSLRQSLHAAPSSLPILCCAAATPMLEKENTVLGAIHTDAGYWAKRHLDSYHGPLAMPIQAAPIAKPIHIQLYQRSFIESLFFETPRGILVSEHGSVLGSAIYYAAQLTDGPIYLIGADLAFADNRSHEKGYRLDIFNSRRTTRTFSYETFDHTHYSMHSYMYRQYHVTKALQIFAESLTLFPSAIFKRLIAVGSPPPGVDIDSIPARQLQKDVSFKKARALQYKEHRSTQSSARFRVTRGLDRMRSCILDGDRSIVRKLQLHLTPHSLRQSNSAVTQATLLQVIELLRNKYL